VIGLLLLGGAAVVGWKVVLPALVRSKPKEVPLSPTAEAGLPAEFLARVEAADDVEASELLRMGRDRYTFASQQRELAALIQSRGAAARLRAIDLLEDRMDESRYTEARKDLVRFAAAWRKQAAGLDAMLDQAQEQDVQRRLADADQLVEDGRYDAARESLDVPGGRFEPDAQERFKKHAATIERRIRVRQYESSSHPPIIDGGTTPVATTGHPSAPPSLPGHPHADVKRLAEANALLAKARVLFRAGKYAPLAKAAAELVGYFGDLKMVERRIDGLRAVRAYARYKTVGFKGLFHATKVAVKGKSVSLTYTFATEDEYFDWEAMKLIPHADSGQFETARMGVRGTGVDGYVNRAFFAADDVELSCEAHIQKPRSHGIGFVEAGNENRQVLLLATNHWFTEGENYVKKRPGHSILLIGKGVNNDVPVDSPEIGFVFKGPSYTRPAPGPGARLVETIAVLGANVRAEVKLRGEGSTLRISARGDDGRGFKRHRPALFVVQAGVIFRNVRIRGRIDPAFEKERESELLDGVESALADSP